MGNNDIIARGLGATGEQALSKAELALQQIASLPSGVVYQGAVETYANLPASSTKGYAYNVKKASTAGTVKFPSGMYVFNGTAWNPFTNADPAEPGTTDFEQLNNRPKYNNAVMDKNTNIPEVKTATWDAKQDALDDGEKEISVKKVTIAGLGSIECESSSDPVYLHMGDQGFIDFGTNIDFDHIKNFNGTLQDSLNNLQDAIDGKSTVSGTVEGENWKTLTINGTTKNIPSGGSGTNDFEQLSNRPKYNGSVMDKNTNIPEVKTSTWDGKQDALTVAQQNAVNSGINASKVEAYDEHKNDTSIHVTADQKTAWNGKQDAISDLDTIRSGAALGATAIQTHQSIKTVNGNNLVGTGDITINPDAKMTGYDFTTNVIIGGITEPIHVDGNTTVQELLYKLLYKEKALTGITITTAPSKVTYNIGENFVTAGMVVTATYDDATTAIVTNYTYSPQTFTVAGAQNVTITYTEAGITKTALQPVTVNDTPVTTIDLYTGGVGAPEEQEDPSEADLPYLTKHSFDAEAEFLGKKQWHVVCGRNDQAERYMGIVVPNTYTVTEWVDTAGLSPMELASLSLSGNRTMYYTPNNSINDYPEGSTWLITIAKA